MAFKLGRPILGHRLVCPELYALLLRRVQHPCPHLSKKLRQKWRESHNLHLALWKTGPVNHWQ